MKNLIFTLIVFCSINIYGQSDLIKKIQTQKKDSVEYKYVKLYTESYAFINVNYVPGKFKTFLFLTNAPEEAKPVFKRLFKKAGFESYDYNDLFKSGIDYTKKDIDSILKAYHIDAFVKIGFNRDIYNSGASFYSSATGIGDIGTVRNTTGAVVKLYVDFYNDKFQKDPFIRTEGMARSGLSSGRDIVLCDKLFWIVLDKLKDKEYIFKQK